MVLSYSIVTWPSALRARSGYPLTINPSCIIVLGFAVVIDSEVRRSQLEIRSVRFPIQASHHQTVHRDEACEWFHFHNEGRWRDSTCRSPSISAQVASDGAESLPYLRYVLAKNIGLQSEAVCDKDHRPGKLKFVHLGRFGGQNLLSSYSALSMNSSFKTAD